MGVAGNIKYFSIFEVGSEGRAVGWPSDIWGQLVFTQSIQTPEQSHHVWVLLPVVGPCGGGGNVSVWLFNL